MEEDLAFTGRGTPEVLKTMRVSANFLDVLGVSPLLGRSFTTPDTCAIISYDLWQHRFHGDFGVSAQTIELAGKVLRHLWRTSTEFCVSVAGIDVWLAKPEDSPAFTPQSRALSPFLSVFGRLRPGISLKQATAEISVLQARYAKGHPAMLDARPKTRPVPTLLQQVIVKDVQFELWLLVGAVGPSFSSPARIWRAFCLPGLWRVPVNSRCGLPWAQAVPASPRICSGRACFWRRWAASREHSLRFSVCRRCVT